MTIPLASLIIIGAVCFMMGVVIGMLIIAWNMPFR
jgi:hypothetical protein